MNDNDIIELYFARDERALDETRIKYGKYCLSIAFNILGNREDAEECENDTYLGAWNSIPPTRPNIFSAFIGRIARNQALKRYRAKTTDKRYMTEAAISLDELSECIPDSTHFLDELEQNELADIINSFLRSLAAEERRVFVCRYWYCDSIADISSQFGFGQSKVKMMLLRTREKLLNYLKKRGVFI